MKTIINKNATGYGYKYTDLAEIHNYLESINSTYIQKIERIENDDYVFTKKCFDGKWEEEWIQGCRVVQATLSGVKNPAQEQGSALTYARRYSLLMAYGLATDDDDAQSLTTKKESDKQSRIENYREQLIRYCNRQSKIENKERDVYMQEISDRFNLTTQSTEDDYKQALLNLKIGE